jgi:hypothetical protein
MAITSTLVENSAARSRRKLTFRHNENGTTYGPHVEFRPDGVDTDAYLLAHRTSLEAWLIEQEIQGNIARALGDPVSIDLTFVPATLVRTTGAQNLTRLREYYGTAKGWIAIRLGWYLKKSNVPDGLMKSTFGLNDAQLATFRTKLTNAESKYETAVGEVGQ